MCVYRLLLDGETEQAAQLDQDAHMLVLGILFVRCFLVLL